MPSLTPSPKSGSPDSIDFELTDFDEARHALDELPAGVREVHRLAPGYWEQRRRGPVPTDRALAGTTLDWLLRLPPRVQPRHLAERYPRVVNAIASTWGDRQRSVAVLDDLIVDHRGGRRGFSPDVDAELHALRDYRAELAY